MHNQETLTEIHSKSFDTHGCSPNPQIAVLESRTLIISVGHFIGQNILKEPETGHTSESFGS